jgi:hypothetical protein
VRYDLSRHRAKAVAPHTQQIAEQQSVTHMSTHTSCTHVTEHGNHVVMSHVYRSRADLDIPTCYRHHTLEMAVACAPLAAANSY